MWLEVKDWRGEWEEVRSEKQQEACSLGRVNTSGFSSEWWGTIGWIQAGEWWDLAHVIHSSFLPLYKEQTSEEKDRSRETG